jgi:hypothetical protein
MMRQPDDFVKVNALMTNPGKPNKFTNRDAGGKVKKAFSLKKSGGAGSGVKKKYESIVTVKAKELLEKLLEPADKAATELARS